MSSYLKFYLRLKDGEDKTPKALMDYCRNTCMYQIVKNEIGVPYYGEGKEENFKSLTKDDINECIRVVDSNLDRIQKRRSNILELNTKVDSDTFYQILEEVDELSNEEQDLFQVKNNLKFYKDILEEISIDCSDFSELLVNYD